jgi:hypothetical protein
MPGSEHVPGDARDQPVQLAVAPRSASQVIKVSYASKLNGEGAIRHPVRCVTSSHFLNVIAIAP